MEKFVNFMSFSARARRGINIIICVAAAVAVVPCSVAPLGFTAASDLCAVMPLTLLFRPINILIYALTAVAYGFLVFSLILRNKYIRTLKVQNKVFGILLNSVPVGVIRCLMDDLLTIIYHNDSFYNTFNCSSGKDQLKLIDMMLPEDLHFATTSIYRQLETAHTFEVRFRSRPKDKTFWILCRGKKYTEGTQNLLYCVLLDVTDTINLEQQQKIDQERYRIVADASDSVIYELSLKDQKIYCTNKFKEKFGFQPKDRFAINLLFRTNFVHPDDQKRLKGLYQAFCNGRPYSTAELRFRKNDGTHIWCEVRYSTIYDERGLPMRAVGKIIDIDKAKRERETLIKANQLDSFTGLYNKATAFELIAKYISKNGRQNSALFFIDIDNFKQVNDTYGHMVGDALLLKVSQTLHTLFRENDIIGRIGGDEILVWLKDYVDLNFVKEKAKMLCESIKALRLEECRDLNVSVSVGIALYPEHGSEFLDVYDKADIALYCVKTEGRDNFKLYDKSLPVNFLKRKGLENT